MVGRVFVLGPDETAILGRSPVATIRVPDERVSRRHARVVGRGGCFGVEDLGSVEGTWVDGELVDGQARLSGPCRIQLGSHVSFRFDLHDRREQSVLRQLHEASVRDPLTAALNRRGLDDRLRAEVSYALRQRVPLAVVMFDLDHFKRVNDRHGHDAGDAVLVAVVRRIERMIRPEDTLARYGGEELCLVLRNLDDGDATVLAERIRRNVERLAIPTRRALVRVTVSAGVAGIDGGRPTSAAALLRRADHALYDAKSSGRNRVVAAP